MMSKKLFPGDAEIRLVLRSLLSKRHPPTSRTVFIEELGLCRGQVRVDLSVVNGQLHGYEIKSDRDSLRRLYSQVELYGKVFDRATLVVGERHLTAGFENVPDWWGVILAYRSAIGLEVKTMRSPLPNPRRDARALVELLWLDNALALLDKRDAARGFRGKARWIVWDRVCEVCDINEIARAVRTQLKARAMKLLPELPLKDDE